MAAVDLDRFDIISRSTRAKDIAGDRCAAQAIVHVNGAACEVGIGCVVVAQIVEMIVPVRITSWNELFSITQSSDVALSPTIAKFSAMSVML